MNYGGGGAGMLQAWLDGVYLGQNVLASGQSAPPTTGTATFTIPTALRTDGPHTLAVMVRDDGHNEDGGVNDAQKEGRGLIAVKMTDADQAAVTPQISWRIQGDLGGEDSPTRSAGRRTTAGCSASATAGTSPAIPTATGRTTTVPAASAMSGTAWYRTTFSLNIPRSTTRRSGLTIGDPSSPRSAADYRALIFVNGWNMGQYIANVGPQHTFVIPNGVLNPDGQNTLALAVTSDGGPGNGLEKVALTNLGTVRGGVPVQMDRSPSLERAHVGLARRRPARWRWRAFTAPRPARPAAVTPSPSPARWPTSAVPRPTTSARRSPCPRGGRRHRRAPTTIGTLARGASQTVSWTVTIPDDATQGSYAVAAIVSYRQGQSTQTTGGTYALSVIPKGLVYICDLPFVSATNGFGPVERDQNVGGSGADDGGPLTIDGVSYAKGLGTNAVSSVVIDVPGRLHAVLQRRRRRRLRRREGERHLQRAGRRRPGRVYRRDARRPARPAPQRRRHRRLAADARRRRRRRRHRPRQRRLG